MNIEDVDKLALLARIKLSAEEKEALVGDLQNIITYVSEIAEVKLGAGTEAATGPHFNVMRDDTNPHESGMYTDDIVASAPRTEKGYLTVKKIL